jgi:hypothetical protein
MLRSIATIAVPCLLVVGCGDNIQPQTEDDTAIDTPGDAPTDARAIEASILIFPDTCEAPIVQFEGAATYSDDGSPVPRFACLWTFDDGTTSTDCLNRHELPTAGSHDFVLDVEDLDTGAIARATQTRILQPRLEAYLDVSTPECGLEISWEATVNTGAEVHVTVEPADQIIAEPDYHLNRTFTLPVRAPGEYTVVMSVEDERGVSEICTARIEKIVTVTKCPCPTKPTCGH